VRLQKEAAISMAWLRDETTTIEPLMTRIRADVPVDFVRIDPHATAPSAVNISIRFGHRLVEVIRRTFLFANPASLYKR